MRKTARHPSKTNRRNTNKNSGSTLVPLIVLFGMLIAVFVVVFLLVNNDGAANQDIEQESVTDPTQIATVKQAADQPITSKSQSMSAAEMHAQVTRKAVNASNPITALSVNKDAIQSKKSNSSKDSMSATMNGEMGMMDTMSMSTMTEPQGEKPKVIKAARERKTFSSSEGWSDYEHSGESVNLQAAADDIDQAILNGLNRKGIKPNPKADDLTFLRRVYLDTIGRIPNKQEFDDFKQYSRFQSQRGMESRNRNALIADLVTRPTYPSHQFNYWTAVLRAQSATGFLNNNQNYINYIKDSLRENKSYDKFVYELLSSEGSPHEFGNGAVGYFFRDYKMPLDNLSLTTQVFLGLDMSCAQCHDDPFSDWTQMDFFQLAGFYHDMRYKRHWQEEKKVNKIRSNPEFKQAKGFKELFLTQKLAVSGSGKGYIDLPYDYQYDDAKPYSYVSARVLYGKQPNINLDLASLKPRGEKYNWHHGSPGQHLGTRKMFAKWVTDHQNDMFVKTIANRMWHKTMGKTAAGALTDLEIDDMGINPDLTRTLMRVMREVKFDLRRFEQIIFMTQAYQREAVSQDIETTENYLFQGPVMHRLSHSQLWDSLMVLRDEKLDVGYELKSHLNPAMKLYEDMKSWTHEDYVYALIEPGRGKYIGIVLSRYSGDRHPAGRPSETMKHLLKNGKTNKNSNEAQGMTNVSASPKKNMKNKKNTKNIKGKSQKRKGQKQPISRNKQKHPESRNGIPLNGKSPLSGKPGYTNYAPSMYGARSNPYARTSSFPVPHKATHFVRQFGQSERMLVDGDLKETSVPQVLNIMNGIAENLAKDRNTSMYRHINSGRDDSSKIRIAYALILNRNPEPFEISIFKRQMAQSQDKVRDIIWTLLNTSEFKFRR